MFASIPLTFLGGILIGIVSDVSKKYVLDVSWLSGLPASLPFIILFIVLLVTPDESWCRRRRRKHARHCNGTVHQCCATASAPWSSRSWRWSPRWST